MIDLKTIPNAPGVYIFKDKNKNILYVGKAKNLKKRISSYFIKKAENFWKSSMIPQINDVEYIIVTNEKEALLLELNKIKQLKPKYNILLKDDKNYCFIKIPNTNYPKIELVRNRLDKKARYIGPFYSMHEVRSLLKSISKIIPFCTCKNYLKTPCIRYHLKLCNCPAVTKISPSEYQKNIKLLEKILNGDVDEIVKIFTEKMEKLAEKLYFEDAQIYKENIDFLNELKNYQSVVSKKEIDTYVVNVALQDNNAIVCVLTYENGVLLDKNIYEILVPIEYIKNNKNIDEIKINILYNFLQQFLFDIQDKKIKNIILPIFVKNKIDDFKKLINLMDLKINIEAPSKNSIKSRYLNIAFINAQQKLQEKLILINKNNEISTILQNYFQLDKKPSKIECFDVSHMSGHNTVCGMVVFVDGVSKKDLYRLFNINSLKEGQIDDFLSLKETLYRRFDYIVNKEKKDISLSELPDIIIIDGGIGQLSLVKEIINFYKDKINKWPLFLSIAKKEETIYMLKNNEIINTSLTKDHPINLYIQKIRDEAHRFTHNKNRKLTSKNYFKSSLDEIPGIGAKKKMKLLKTFGSIQNIKNASDEDLLKIINKKDLKNLREYL